MVCVLLSAVHHILVSADTPEKLWVTWRANRLELCELTGVGMVYSMTTTVYTPCDGLDPAWTRLEARGPVLTYRFRYVVVRG